MVHLAGADFVLADDTPARGRQDGCKMARMWRLVLARNRWPTDNALKRLDLSKMSETPFRITGLDHLVLRVRDLDRMVRFYCEVLGCRVERVQVELGLTQIRAGRSLIDLVTVGGKLGRMGGAAPGKEGRNLDHFCITVDGYDEAAIRAHLTVRGVEIGEAGSRYGAEGEGPSLYISDPEGNVVELKGPPTAPAKKA
jgi:glyoxylase I family protein